MRHSVDTINKVRGLRKTGHSISELMSAFSLPKTTVWHHIQGVKIPSKYTKILRSKQGGSIIRKQKEVEKARAQASHYIPRELDTKTAAMLAALLYWGEGAKRDFNLANSDPDLIRLFMACMKKLGIGPERFALHVRTYSDLNKNAAIQHWSNITNIPKSNLVRVEVLKGRKEGKLPYGMCRIRLYKGSYQLKFLTAIREHLLKLI